MSKGCFFWKGSSVNEDHQKIKGLNRAAIEVRESPTVPQKTMAYSIRLLGENISVCMLSDKALQQHTEAVQLSTKGAARAPYTAVQAAMCMSPKSWKISHVKTNDKNTLFFPPVLHKLRTP